MKILQFITNLTSGGAEKLVYDMSIKLKELGHEVEVLVLFSKNNIYIEELRDNGIKVKELSYNSRFNPLNIFKLILTVNKSKYDVVNTHLFPALYFGAVAAIFSKKIRFIYTEHSTTNKRREKKNLRYIEKFIYSKFDHIICISKKAEKKLREYLNDDSDRISTIENGIDIKKFSSSEPILRKNINENLGKKDFLITMIGRFSEAKDQKTVIKALKKLPSNYKLILIGEGNLKADCEDLVQQEGLEERVFFLGLRKDIPQILKASNTGVLSSFYEGLPLSAIEIMAVGLPFLGSDVDGIKDLFEDKENLFECENSNELAEMILEISKNEKRKEELIKKSREISNNYSIEKMIEKYLLIYNKNLKN